MRKMITRTVIKTNAECLCMNVTEGKAEIRHFEIGGHYESKEQLLKKVQKVFDTDTFKVVTVTGSVEEEVLLGMSEEDFIRNAVVMPPRPASQQKKENRKEVK